MGRKRSGSTGADSHDDIGCRMRASTGYVLREPFGLIWQLGVISPNSDLSSAGPQPAQSEHDLYLPTGDGDTNNRQWR